MFAVTLEQLRTNGACFSGYNKVIRALQGKQFTEEDEDRTSYLRHKHDLPINLIDILESNDLDDALWATCLLVGHDRDLRLYAVWCARQVQHLMKDRRSIAALDIAEAYANRQATQQELDAAYAAAYAASDAARTAARAAASAVASATSAAAYDAARTADYAAYAAYAAARAAARAAACAVASTADYAASAAAYAAYDAASTAAYASQKEMFILMCKYKAPWQISERK